MRWRFRQHPRVLGPCPPPARLPGRRARPRQRETRDGATRRDAARRARARPRVLSPNAACAAYRDDRIARREGRPFVRSSASTRPTAARGRAREARSLDLGRTDERGEAPGEGASEDAASRAKGSMSGTTPPSDPGWTEVDDYEIAAIARFERQALDERSRSPTRSLQERPAAPAPVAGGRAGVGGRAPFGRSAPRTSTLACDDFDWLIAGDDGAGEPVQEGEAEDRPIDEDQQGEPVQWTWCSRGGEGEQASRTSSSARPLLGASSRVGEKIEVGYAQSDAQRHPPGRLGGRTKGGGDLAGRRTPSLERLDSLSLGAFLPASLVAALHGDTSAPVLHAWQIECLSLPGVLEGRNLAFAAPTGAGKSLVATTLLLRRVFATGRPALVVLPYVSLCEQWTKALERPMRVMGRSVARAFGSASAPLPNDAGAVVCTIERANLLVNRLLAAGELDTLCCCVVDELHMVADPYRGHQLETLLANLRYAASMSAEASSRHQEPPPGARAAPETSQGAFVVSRGLSSSGSARDGGAEDGAFPCGDRALDRAPANGLGMPPSRLPDDRRASRHATVTALGAGRGETSGTVFSAVARTFLPVDAVGDPAALQIVGMSATIGNVEKIGAWLDAATFLTRFRPVVLHESVKVGNELQDVSGRVVRRLQPPFNWPHWDRDLVCWLALETAKQGRQVLVFCATKHLCEVAARNVAALWSRGPRGCPPASSALTTSSDGDKDALAPLIAVGVAFHHAGLSPDRRRYVERLFMAGKVKVLVATSTLAVGVNLPARRVIIQHGYVRLPSPEYALSPELYAQMAGRAGRCGFDDEGECILVAGPCMSSHRARELIAAGGGEVSSRLANGDGMRRGILDAVAAGMVSTPEDIRAYLASTLLAATGDPKVSLARRARPSCSRMPQRRGEREGVLGKEGAVRTSESRRERGGLHLGAVSFAFATAIQRRRHSNTTPLVSLARAACSRATPATVCACSPRAVPSCAGNPSCSLFFFHGLQIAVSTVKDATKWLVERGSLLKWSNVESRYYATALGKACFESGMSPDHCVEIHVRAKRRSGSMRATRRHESRCLQLPVHLAAFSAFLPG